MQVVNIKISLIAVMFLVNSLATVQAQSISKSAPDSTLLKPRFQLTIDYKSNLNDFRSIRKRGPSQSYVDRLPFFCKMEHRMSVNAKIPVRIRLGSLDYVNKLEGKGH